MRLKPQRILGLAAAWACLALTASELSAAEYEQRQLDGTAVLRLGSDRAEQDLVEMSLGLERTLSVTIEGAAPLVIQNEAGLIDAQKAAVGMIWDYQCTVHKETLAGNRDRWQLAFRIDPRAEKGKKYPVEHRLQLIPISFQVGGSPGLQTAHWRSVMIRITTLVENPDQPSLSQLRDITGIEVTPVGTIRQRVIQNLRVFGFALLAAAVVLGLYRFFRKRADRAAELPPTQWALRELDLIEAQRLPEAGQAERYHTLLSDVVRQYLELHFRLRAPQQTTSEFLTAMQSWPRLPFQQQTLLRDFLERCDLVKFAQAKPSLAECRAAGAMARALVDQNTSMQPQPT
jgi:hypothetical protein